MRTLLLALLAGILPAIASADFETRTMTHAKLDRSYLLELPKLSPPRGLILFLHGGTDSASHFAAQIPALRSEALNKNFLLLLPNGHKGVWEDGRPEKMVNSDDIGFIRELLTETIKEFHVPAGNIFAVGFSNGGGMVYRLACELPDLVRMGVAVSMTMPAELSKHCSSEVPFSLLMIPTRGDPVVPFSGGTVTNKSVKVGMVLSAEATRNFWKKKNKSMAPVRMQVIESNEHDWPQNKGITKSVLDFFLEGSSK